LETFPVYIRHLKKFMSAIEKLPIGKEAPANTEKLPAENETPSDRALSEAPWTTSQRLEPSRKSSRHEQPPGPSTEHVDKHRRSTGVREKSRSSTDRRERSRRRSVDTFERATIDENEQTDKPRKSIDRLVLPLLSILYHQAELHYLQSSDLQKPYNDDSRGQKLFEGQFTLRCIDIRVNIWQAWRDD
jgi:hypothetical protein